MAAPSAWLKLSPLRLTTTTTTIPTMSRLALRWTLPRSSQLLPFHCSASLPHQGAAAAAAAAAGAAAGGAAAGGKEQLQRLRKRTGLPFSACRAALNKFQGDDGKAEEWLQREAHRLGLARATKLEGRSTQQGMLGVVHHGRSAAMVEVACETDFVSRSDVFQQLVQVAVAAVAAHGDSRSPETHSYTRVALSGEEILRLSSAETKSTLAEVLALAVGRLGERVVIQRGCWLGVPAGTLISTYVHGAPPPESPTESPTDSPTDSPTESPVTLLGKFAGLVVLRQHPAERVEVVDKVDKVDEVEVVDKVEVEGVEEVGRRLAQHVVGMAPLSLGGRQAAEVAVEGDGGAETELMSQPYLLDPSLSVEQKLRDVGVEVVDFVRYESGETSTSSQ